MEEVKDEGSSDEGTQSISYTLDFRYPHQPEQAHRLTVRWTTCK